MTTPTHTVLTLCLHKNNSLVSKAIKWQTRGEYSHASLLHDDTGRLVESLQGQGVIANRYFSDVIEQEPVDCFKLFLPAEDYHKAWRFAFDQLGKKYDWSSVVRFVTRQQARRRDAGVWFCSELVMAVTMQTTRPLFINTDPWEVSPQLIARSPQLLGPFST